MLTMDEINHIKYLRDRKGQSLREIARETGHAFETVKKYAEKQDFNIARRKQRRKSKLDPYKAIIDEWLTNDLKERPKQRHTAKRVYDRLQEMYGIEFKVSERTVRYYVSAKKKELYTNNDCSIPLEHSPGKAQADFGEADFIENGERFTGLYLTLSFPYSNAGFTQVFKGQNLECLETGLKNIFEYIGKIPGGILFDNPPTIVKKVLEYGKREITENFKRFALHYGFKTNFCNPARAQEKGHVENKVGYSRRNFFVPVPEFKDLEEFNKDLLEKAVQDMQRKHYKKGRLIADLFTEDLTAMHNLPETPFEIGRYEKVKADKYAKVRFDNKQYSTSPIFAGKQLWIRATAQEIIVMDEDWHEVIRHQRLYGKKQEAMNWVPYLQLMAKRPTALKYTAFFHQLPEILQEYFAQCHYPQKKASLNILRKMVEETDLETATSAFEQALDQGVSDPDSIWLTFYRMNNPTIELPELTLKESTPQLPAFTTDTAFYDLLLMKGAVSCKK